MLGEHAGHCLPYRTLRGYCGITAHLLMLRPHTHSMGSRRRAWLNGPESVRVAPAKTSERVARWILHIFHLAIRASTGQKMLLIALLCQILLLYLAGELLDLYVSAVELWAEMARKHLELTM